LARKKKNSGDKGYRVVTPEEKPAQSSVVKKKAYDRPKVYGSTSIRGRGAIRQAKSRQEAHMQNVRGSLGKEEGRRLGSIADKNFPDRSSVVDSKVSALESERNSQVQGAQRSKEQASVNPKRRFESDKSYQKRATEINKRNKRRMARESSSSPISRGVSRVEQEYRGAAMANKDNNAAIVAQRRVEKAQRREAWKGMSLKEKAEDVKGRIHNSSVATSWRDQGLSKGRTNKVKPAPPPKIKSDTAAVAEYGASRAKQGAGVVRAKSVEVAQRAAGLARAHPVAAAAVGVGALALGGAHVARKRAQKRRQMTALEYFSAGYDKGDVWSNPDGVVAGKEYKSFYSPKSFFA